MTWREFKEVVEDQITDEDSTVLSIDWDGDSKPDVIRVGESHDFVIE